MARLPEIRGMYQFNASIFSLPLSISFPLAFFVSWHSNNWAWERKNFRELKVKREKMVRKLSENFPFLLQERSSEWERERKVWESNRTALKGRVRFYFQTKAREKIQDEKVSTGELTRPKPGERTLHQFRRNPNRNFMMMTMARRQTMIVVVIIHFVALSNQGIKMCYPPKKTYRENHDFAWSGRNCAKVPFACSIFRCLFFWAECMQIQDDKFSSKHEQLPFFPGLHTC